LGIIIFCCLLFYENRRRGNGFYHSGTDVLDLSGLFFSVPASFFITSFFRWSKYREWHNLENFLVQLITIILYYIPVFNWTYMAAARRDLYYGNCRHCRFPVCRFIILFVSCIKKRQQKNKKKKVEMESNLTKLSSTNLKSRTNPQTISRKFMIISAGT